MNKEKRRKRVVLTTLGLDGHDHGINVLKDFLIEQGFEVFYFGLNRDWFDVFAAALEEGADYFGVSVHSGAHLEYLRTLPYARVMLNGFSLELLAGGIISEEDGKKLKELGFAEIFPSGTPKARLDEIKKFFDSKKIDGNERIEEIKKTLREDRNNGNAIQDFIPLNSLFHWQHGLGWLISELANGNAAARELVEGLPDIKTLPSAPSWPERKIMTFGVTGPLGVGKSSLINKLIGEFVARRGKVGVIAVDPSDHISGGALLGRDRTRMWRPVHRGFAHIYSMASRDCYTGIAEAVPLAAKAMHAAGYDIVIVETIGVGQNQVEIKNIVDKTVLVLTPDVGEDQVYKSGLTQIADIYAINKSDLLPAEPLEAAINKMLDEKSAFSGGKRPSVFKTAANKEENNGVKELVDSLLECSRGDDCSCKN